jgi:hypothetical protein
MNTTLSFSTLAFNHHFQGLLATVAQWVRQHATANKTPIDQALSVQQARQVARQWALLDPRSAADLLAAADRYEQASQC